MPVRRPCLDCGKVATASRCVDCLRKHNAAREARRDPHRKELYNAEYRKAAALVRATATTCWLCGEGARANDPWQADHVVAGDPASPLAPAHRSCNIRRAHEMKRNAKA